MTSKNKIIQNFPLTKEERGNLAKYRKHIKASNSKSSQEFNYCQQGERLSHKAKYVKHGAAKAYIHLELVCGLDQGASSANDRTIGE